MRRSLGFTLLEVLVAMSIFSVIGLGATQMLRTMIKSHDRTQERVADFNSVTQAFMLLERDLVQVINRPVRDEYGDPQPSLMVASGAYPLVFTRTGWNNPAQRPRSGLQRVAYELDANGSLLRHFWLVLDRAQDSAMQTQVLLAGVKDLRIQVVDDQGELLDSWPDANHASALPAGIELVIETEAMGALRRVFPLVSAAVVRTPSVGPDGGNNGENDSDTTADDADGAQDDNMIEPVIEPEVESQDDSGQDNGTQDNSTQDNNDDEVLDQ
jgi:general secretion pathway protein J